MDSLLVGQDLLLREGATFRGEVILRGPKVGGDLDVSFATFNGMLDGSAAAIEGELRLGSSRHLRARWKSAARLVFCKTSVGANQDRLDKESDGKLLDAWPERLQLDGFTYRRRGGLGGEGQSEMIDRSASWYVEWLERDERFSPQPYRQLAAVLCEADADDEANAAPYALRERERGGAALATGGSA